MGVTRKVIVVGSGPAGYAAAIYTARAELKPLVLAGFNSGGQLMNTTVVENWPGAKDGVMGPELMIAMREQAQKFGAEIVDDKVTKVDFSRGPFKVWVGDNEYKAQAVIVATGAESMMLGVPGEKELLGKGVATCAVCDAAFYKDKVVVVVGGGDAAIEDAMALTKFASKVVMLVRRDEFRASKAMVRKVEENEKIEVKWNMVVREILGEQKVEKIRVVDNQTNQEEEMAIDGLFLAIGHKPATEVFKGQVELDEKGYMKTGLTYPQELASKGEESGWLNGYPTMTSVAGVFGAGDNVDFRYRQAATAAGMGVQAALDAEKWLEGIKK